MRFRDLLDVSLGALRLPFRASAANPGDMALDVKRVRVRGTEGTHFGLLSDLDYNQPGGVPQLDGNGVIPPTILPAGATTGFDIGDVKWLCRANPADIPTDTLPCDGREVLRVLYPVLAIRIGASCGSPSSDAVVRLPNLMDRSPVGAPGGTAAKGGRLNRVGVLNRGAGFTPGSHVLTVQGGAFSAPAQVRVRVNAGGWIESINPFAPGSYDDVGSPVAGSNCALTIPWGSIGGGTGASVEFYVSSHGTPGWYLYPTDQGSGYSTPPEIVIAGSLFGATAVAEIENGRVIRVLVTNPGSGDLSAPTATLSGGGGGGAALSFHQTSAVGVMGARRGEDAHLPTRAEMVNHTHDLITGGYPTPSGSRTHFGPYLGYDPGLDGTEGVKDFAGGNRANSVGPGVYLIPVIKVL